MIQGLLGTKIGMSRWFDSEGNSAGVTLISCCPCYVIDKRDNKIEIGYEEIKKSRLSKPRLGYFKKRNLPPLKYRKSVKWYGKEGEQPEVGERIDMDIFKIGEKINVQSISKGKGFAGVIKRWGFKGGPGSHGSRLGRAPGSIGQASSPSRVFPGMKMAGRKGGQKVTTRNLEVVNIDKDENIIAVKGAVPGPKKSLVFLQRSTKESSTGNKNES